MNKVFNLWNNLIKRYSFYSILLLSFIEYNFLIYFIPHYEISHLNFIHIQSTFLFFNIICIYTIYKLEEKYSNFITNKFLLKNKLYHFLLSIFYLLVLIFFFFQCLDFILEIGYILCMLYKFALNTCPTLIDELIDIITTPIVLFMTVISAH